jgi:hypothetical protein
MSNIVIAKFGNTKSIVTDEIWQWNYGQILRIQGLKLPRAVEVHFSMGNASKTRIGTTIDNVTDVVIPDSLIEQSGRLKAYVYLHVGDDDGETEYEITIPVKALTSTPAEGTPMVDPKAMPRPQRKSSDSAAVAEGSMPPPPPGMSRETSP